VEKLRSLCKQQKEEREGLDWKLQEVASLEEEIEELRLELEIARKEQKTILDGFDFSFSFSDMVSFSSSLISSSCSSSSVTRSLELSAE
jgi:hypothetical protein